MLSPDPMLQQLGFVGLLLTVLGHFLYTAYENRRGTVKKTQNRVDEVETDIHERMDGMAIVQYRQAQELEGFDEEAVRNLLFNGHEVVFPSDFDEEKYKPPTYDDSD